MSPFSVDFNDLVQAILEKKARQVPRLLPSTSTSLRQLGLRALKAPFLSLKHQILIIPITSFLGGDFRDFVRVNLEVNDGKARRALCALRSLRHSEETYFLYLIQEDQILD